MKNKKPRDYGYGNVKPGDRFGRLVALHKVGYKTYKNSDIAGQWLCKCDCGNEKVVVGVYLSRGEVKKCDKCARGNGLVLKRLYHIADAIVERCRNYKNKYYYNYGGRGIMCELGNTAGEVCLELEKVPGYFEGAQIDRVDNNGNYTIMHPIHGDKVWIYHDPNDNKDYQCLGNLRWVTRSTNMRNTRSAITLNNVSERSRLHKYMRIACELRGWDINDFTRIKDPNGGSKWFYSISDENRKKYEE